MKTLTQWLRSRPIRSDARFVLTGILDELGPSAVQRALETTRSADGYCFLAAALGVPSQMAGQRAVLRARFAASTRHAAWLADWVTELWRKREPAVRAVACEWLRSRVPGAPPS